jgi:HK97 gp10 family phage protein
MIGIKLDVEKVTKGLNILEEDLKSAIGTAISKSALTIEGQSKTNSPVDTGRMRSSIFSDIHPLTASIMPNVSYAVFVHFGTRYMKARPFMYDALDQKKGEITDIFEREIEKAVAKFN